MIIEKIAGHLELTETNGRHIERVRLRSDDLVKRIQRMTTDHGRELGIRLQEQKDLRDGDILYMDERNMIVVSVIADELLVIQPTSLTQMGEIAHNLGNRHLPAQFENEEMLVQYDYLVEELLIQAGIPYVRQQRTVKQPFRHIGHHHG